MGERKEDKLFGVKEREDMRGAGTEGIGIREQTERNTEKKRSEKGLGYLHRLTPLRQHMPAHTHAHPHKGQGVRASIGTAARSMTLYISKERDSNTRGLRRSP